MNLPLIGRQWPMSNLNRPGYCPERQSRNQGSGSRHERPKRRCRRLRGRSWATDGTRIKHGKERNSYGFGKRGDHGEDTKALSLATRSFTWKVSFGNPCSIRVPSVARLKILSKMKDFFL